MAIFTVDTLNDTIAGDGKLSLREAVAQANANPNQDTIRFAASLEGQTLVLTQGELALSQDVTIDGDQDNDGSQVTLSGGQENRIFHVTGSSTDVQLNDLVLKDGWADYASSDGVGGGVKLDAGSLTLNGSTITGSYVRDEGAAIWAAAGTTVSVLDSSIVGNGTYFNGGGGIAADRATIVVRNSNFGHNHSGEDGGGGGAIAAGGGSITIEDSTFTNNDSNIGFYGGALNIGDATVTIVRSSFTDNTSVLGGGAIAVRNSNLTIADSTIAGNTASEGDGGGILSRDSDLVVRNSTLTGNHAGFDFSVQDGGGIWASGSLELGNTIVAGNSVEAGGAGPDVFGTFTRSNGHNLFGSEVAGDIAGDRVVADIATIFAAVDPGTGGGELRNGVVPLLASTANPAISGGDLLAAGATAQLGGERPYPYGTLPDIGAVENRLAPSHTASANNDVLSGTSGSNNLSGYGGADLISGFGGADTLRGGNGSDLLDGGTGNDRLDGGAGIDLVRYSGSAGVTVNLGGSSDTAVQGTARDTLVSIEGAIGGSGNDRFYGDSSANFFQGGLGHDLFTGGAGSDLFDFNALAESKVGTAHDVITDFKHLTDKIDLSGIDADPAVAGDQALEWLGTGGFDGTPGEVRYGVSGSNTLVLVSTDADTAPEFEIQLTGKPVLTADDFYL